MDDPDGYLPPALQNMPEKLLMISNHNLLTLQGYARQAKSGLLENAYDIAEEAGKPTAPVLVNGMHKPTTTLESLTWYRVAVVWGGSVPVKYFGDSVRFQSLRTVQVVGT